MYKVVPDALHFNQFIHHLKTIKKFIKLDSALGYTQQNPIEVNGNCACISRGSI